MTIQEAVKSGKKYKRAKNSDWLYPNTPYLVSLEGILATDWEIEEEKIELTRTQVIEAYRSTRRPDLQQLLDMLASLGFKDVR